MWSWGVPEWSGGTHSSSGSPGTRLDHTWSKHHVWSGSDLKCSSHEWMWSAWSHVMYTWSMSDPTDHTWFSYKMDMEHVVIWSDPDVIQVDVNHMWSWISLLDHWMTVINLYAADHMWSACDQRVIHDQLETAHFLSDPQITSGSHVILFSRVIWSDPKWSGVIQSDLKIVLFSDHVRTTFRSRVV